MGTKGNLFDAIMDGDRNSRISASKIGESSKRRRVEEDLISEESSIAEEEAMSIDAEDGKIGAGGARTGMRLFDPHKPLKVLNTAIHKYTKHFYFKIYANDWLSNSTETYKDVIGFQSWIPYQALCMYISPDEYLRLIREYGYAKIKETKMQMEFKAVRTPFDANSTDLAEANGNLQFEIQRWDGIEKHMLPFHTADVALDGTITKYAGYSELIERLYGKQGMGQNASLAPPPWPATMRERGLTYRPIWRMSNGDQLGGLGEMARPINEVISCLPIGEYVTDRLNTNQAKMGEGYCFSKICHPKNGIITQAPSAFNYSVPAVDSAHTRINIKQRMQDTIAGPQTDENLYQSLYPQIAHDTTLVSWINDNRDPATDGLRSFSSLANPTITPGYLPSSTSTAVPPQFGDVWNTTVSTAFQQKEVLSDSTIIPDAVGYGYNLEMGWYNYADIENYSMFTANNDIPIHHLPSMLLGAIPKTTKDDKFVNATLEFECTTEMTVEVNFNNPTYMNLSYNPIADTVNYPIGWSDARVAQAQISNPAFVYGGKWDHSERGVLIRDPKYWTHDYGRAGKPMFVNFDNSIITRK